MVPSPVTGRPGRRPRGSRHLCSPRRAGSRVVRRSRGAGAGTGPPAPEPLTDKQAQVQELASRAAEQLAQIQAATPSETAPSVRSEVTQQEGASGGESNEGWTTSESRESPTNEAIEPESDAVIQLRTFTVKKLDLPRERQARRAAGKRTSTKSETKRGRYVRSSQTERVTDVAFDATVRAAAPHQLSRRQAAPDAINQLQLESQDLRQKVRERKTGNLIVFVVDASASMDAEQRMLATKGAILSLLRHAYVRRDKVALVAFSGRNARVVLRPLPASTSPSAGWNGSASAAPRRSPMGS